MAFFKSFNQGEDAIKVELQAILRQDSAKYYANKCNYFEACNANCPTLNKKRQVNEGWREKVCEWLFEVVDHFEFDREVVLIALCYLDRAASIETKKLKKGITPKQFQILAVTSLYVATKVHGEISQDSKSSTRCKLKIDTFIELSRGLLTAPELEKKELEILDLLDWHVNPPTAVRIIASLLHFLPNYSPTTGQPLTAKIELYEISRYLAEVGACVSSIALNYKSSEIAYASILCAFNTLEAGNEIPYDMLVEFMNKVLASIGLSPQSVATLKCRLKELCPSMFPQHDSFSSLEDSIASFDEGASSKVSSEENGKESPVFVQHFRE